MRTLLLLVFVATLRAQSLASDDFETQDTSTWAAGITQTNGTVAVTADMPHSGLWSTKHTLSSGTVNTLMRQNYTATAIAYGRVFFYVDPALTVTGTVRLLELSNSSVTTPVTALLSNVGGVLKVRLNSTNGSTTITKGAWHSVEISYDSTGGTATLILDGGGTPEVSVSGLTLNPAATVRLGCYGTATGVIYFDDLIVSTTPIGAPAVGLIVRHPDTFARTGMPVQTTMWGWTATDQLVTTVGGTEVARTPASAVLTQRFSLVPFAPGNYTMTVTLLDQAAATKATWSETIQRWTTGAVVIDKDNNLSRNGSLVFPVTPFMQNPDQWTPYWSNGWANMYGWSSGWAEPYSAAQYQTFIEAVGQPSIGPDSRWCAGANTGTRCSNEPGATTAAAVYATALKDHPLVFAWTWGDEPDLGGGRIPAATYQAVTNAVRAVDVNHPSAVNLYGYSIDTTRQKGYLYPSLIADIYAADYYPFIYRTDTSLTTIAKWLSMIDTYQRYNYGLTPWLTFVESGIQPCPDPPTCTGGNGPTAAQLRMEAWLAVIHGMKGISWWGPEGTWTYIDAAHKVEMARFVSDIAALKDIVLAPVTSRTVASNRTTTGSRVDAMVRENGVPWVFAARASEYGEADTISATLTISGVSGTSTVTVYGESRTLTATDGVFTDSFAPSAVHIYQMAGNAIVRGTIRGNIGH